MKRSIGVAILAAGEGKRLKTSIPKPLLPLLGQRMIDFPFQVSRQFVEECSLTGLYGVVVGHKREEVKSYLTEKYKNDSSLIKFAVQESQLGTADALKAYFNGIPEAKQTDYTLIMCADVPLIKKEDLKKLYLQIEQLEKKKPRDNINGVAATFEVENPTGYGRIVYNSNDFKIVEEKNIQGEEGKIKEVNASLYILKTSYLTRYLSQITANSVSGEFYLTDLIQGNLGVQTVVFGLNNRFSGVNTLQQLEEVSRLLGEEKINEVREKGVILHDPKTFYVDWDVEVGQGSVIYPNVYLQGRVRIGKEVTIEPGSIVKNSSIGDKVIIRPYSYIDQSLVHSAAEIGPYARLRPGVEIGDQAKIGNFVELKKAKVERKAKISHLSYIGDAEIGEESNIGCGFITCNYDGINKHFTKVGHHTFIGSDCQVVAPIEIGSNSFVAAGSTLTQSVPDDSFAVARSRQVNKEGMAKKFLKKEKIT